MSYLTAVMQHTARQKGLPLDNVKILIFFFLI